MRYFEPIEKKRRNRKAGGCGFSSRQEKIRYIIFHRFRTGSFCPARGGEIGLDVEKKGELPFGLPVLEQK
jgi:hypothetical protein